MHCHQCECQGGEKGDRDVMVLRELGEVGRAVCSSRRHAEPKTAAREWAKLTREAGTSEAFPPFPHH